MASSTSFLLISPWLLPPRGITSRRRPLPNWRRPLAASLVSSSPPRQPPAAIASLHSHPLLLDPFDETLDHLDPAIEFPWLELPFPLDSPTIPLKIQFCPDPDLNSPESSPEKLDSGDAAIAAEPEKKKAKRREGYRSLRRRQVKAEAEMWEKAAEEYKALERVMLEKKLAPSLPYVKSLFLGWFEPLRDAIAAEQERQRTKVRGRQAYARHIGLVPADKMAVIVMHKVMRLLMVGPDEGCVRVLQAAVQIGEAVELEFKVRTFLEKSKRHGRRKKQGEDQILSSEHEQRQKRVKNLVKMKKMIEVQKLIKNEIEMPWSRDAQAKLGIILIELLLKSAFVQAPPDQSGDCFPEIHPAFKHVMRSAAKEDGKIRNKYGVIECDPLVHKGLEGTARHVVIPYLPMLVPPKRWKGYDNGGYLFLPSYIMRTHGAKDQQDAMKSVPRRQLQKVFEALDSLGSTKWRVNRRVLDVIETIWSQGGGIAGLVDRRDIPVDERPESDDPVELRKWKWNVKKVKKANCELHAQRCDIELKLSDGSCNGLQHYAALGRDNMEAAAVNLVAGEKPADVYSGIASRVMAIMRNDSRKDSTSNRTASLAKALVDQVDRKLVKQTVMTSVYGVTYVGARQQIKRRLEEKGLITDENLLFNASCYAAKVTMNALGEMFQAARNIMKWLSDCAKIIAIENQPVRWTTPLGLPVVQPYRNYERYLIRTSLQDLSLQREGHAVSVKKQKTAFPPNFVHSLDSSHMMMTAIACKDAGLNFAGVHDSFWTHACDVDRMNQILREQFVELYNIPILENLLEDFQTSFPTLTFPPLPERGDLDLRSVLESPYFFN